MLETTDCEFIDGFHGGDVLYAKILKYLSDQEPLLSEFVDSKALNKIIDSYSGLAMIPNPKITSKPEIDFLRLGCVKSLRKGLSS
ncbi:hypothetical protein [Candidatus Odyssella acanthamoebae]|uniref:Uncharacterized protein n=1 Tax=Candidatus Odyssella acanthamoebae TaxID=91604 RepID=A0A077AVC2_9PROT|nr:hypothetical protein [Candidatus Paracaedibacter acanthamoebae]AIK95593.1 hypothetical protein ID47_00690 [Candidatus Paracaedibacter acanthamoebae]